MLTQEAWRTNKGKLEAVTNKEKWYRTVDRHMVGKGTWLSSKHGDLDCSNNIRQGKEKKTFW